MSFDFKDSVKSRFNVSIELSYINNKPGICLTFSKVVDPFSVAEKKSKGIFFE